MAPQESLDTATDRLVRNAYLLGAAPAVVLGLLGAIVHPLIGLAMLVIAAVCWVLALRQRLAGAVERLVEPMGGVEFDPDERPRLANVLDGLCVTGGVHQPRVIVVASESINAMVAADRDAATIVVTSGLLDGLGLVQMEGVVANLLGRVKDGSARYATTVVALLGASARADRRLQAGFGDQRAVHSDLAAVDMTRYPPGLVSALRELESSGTEVPQAPPASRHLWLAAPGPGVGGGDLDDSTMQPLEVRIAVLEQL